MNLKSQIQIALSRKISDAVREINKEFGVTICRFDIDFIPVTSMGQPTRFVSGATNIEIIKTDPDGTAWRA